MYWTVLDTYLLGVPIIEGLQKQISCHLSSWHYKMLHHCHACLSHWSKWPEVLCASQRLTQPALKQVRFQWEWIAGGSWEVPGRINVGSREGRGNFMSGKRRILMAELHIRSYLQPSLLTVSLPTYDNKIGCVVQGDTWMVSQSMERTVKIFFFLPSLS